MKSLAALVANENMKIYRRPRTWILAVILLVLLAAFSVFEMQNAAKAGEEDWRANVQAQLENDRRALKDMEDAPPAIKERLANEIKLREYELEHDLNPFRTNVWTFFSNSTVLMSVVTLFVVLVGSDVVASEFTWGSIKMLLIRPFRRWQILLSKYAAILLLCLAFCAELIIASWVVGGVLFGFESFDYASLTISGDGEIEKHIVSLYALKMFGLQLLSTVFIVTIAFMISTLFRTSGLAIGFSIFLLFSMNVLTTFLSRYDWAKYTLFPNLYLSYYGNHTEGVIEGMTLSFSIAADLMYTAAFLLITWWVFNKRDIAS
ncbi:MAG TPA: ABC transporter permease [Bacillales bacterium]|nr:ABC transporter permease [Bacillales bacterium]